MAGFVNIHEARQNLNQLGIKQRAGRSCAALVDYFTQHSKKQQDFCKPWWFIVMEPTASQVISLSSQHLQWSFSADQWVYVVYMLSPGCSVITSIQSNIFGNGGWWLFSLNSCHPCATPLLPKLNQNIKREQSIQVTSSNLELCINLKMPSGGAAIAVEQHCTGCVKGI